MMAGRRFTPAPRTPILTKAYVIIFILKRTDPYPNGLTHIQTD